MLRKASSVIKWIFVDTGRKAIKIFKKFRLFSLHSPLLRKSKRDILAHTVMKKQIFLFTPLATEMFHFTRFTL